MYGPQTLLEKNEFCRAQQQRAEISVPDGAHALHWTHTNGCNHSYELVLQLQEGDDEQYTDAESNRTMKADLLQTT
eukprot:COSAG03_NODE_15724_length_422_cov_0.866873_1_plen_75_part_01